MCERIVKAPLNLTTCIFHLSFFLSILFSFSFFSVFLGNKPLLFLFIFHLSFLLFYYIKCTLHVHIYMYIYRYVCMYACTYIQVSTTYTVYFSSGIGIIFPLVLLSFSFFFFRKRILAVGANRTRANDANRLLFCQGDTEILHSLGHPLLYPTFTHSPYFRLSSRFFVSPFPTVTLLLTMYLPRSLISFSRIRLWSSHSSSFNAQFHSIFEHQNWIKLNDANDFDTMKDSFDFLIITTFFPSFLFCLSFIFLMKCKKF